MHKSALSRFRIIDLMENPSSFECCYQLLLIDEASILRLGILFAPRLIIQDIHEVKVAYNGRIIRHILNVVNAFVHHSIAATALIVSHFFFIC